MSLGSTLGTIGGVVAGPIGAVGGYAYGSAYDQQKQAAEAKAAADQKIAEEQLKFQKETQQKAEGFAAPSMDELMLIQQQLQHMSRLYTLQDAAYNRDLNLVNSIDPNIVSAGQNTYAIMNGKAAPTLDPIQKQRDIQRRQLETQLSQRMGPGYATSSAGIEALNNFDLQTSTLMTQAQQSYLGSLGSLTAQLSGARPNLAGQVNSNAMTMGQLTGSLEGQLGAIKNRQIGATIGTNPAPYGGAQYIGDAERAQGNASQAAQTLGTLTSLGAAGIGYAAGGGFSGGGAKTGTQLKTADLSYGSGNSAANTRTPLLYNSGAVA